MSAQLPLGLSLRDGSSFANFVAGSNGEALDSVRALLEPSGGAAVLFLWGERGVGKTHLLEACAREAQARGETARYIALGEPGLAPPILEGAEQAFVVCIDDVDRIAGQSEWERALFAVAERLRQSSGRLLAAATAAPTRLGLGLADLASRLGWGPVYQLHPLADADKLEALRLRARNRGLELPPDAARYILTRYPRAMDALFALLERLDEASLVQQRRITIPFLRSLEAAPPANGTARKSSPTR